MPRARIPAPHTKIPKNPVTLLDYVSFGVGAVGGAFISHHFLYSDLGHSIPAGGFAAMGVSRAAVASTRSWFMTRELAKREKAIAQRLNNTRDFPVNDLKARLAVAEANWENGNGIFLTNHQFEGILNDLVADFNARQLAHLTSQDAVPPAPAV